MIAACQYIHKPMVAHMIWVELSITPKSLTLNMYVKWYQV